MESGIGVFFEAMLAIPVAPASLLRFAAPENARLHIALVEPKVHELMPCVISNIAWIYGNRPDVALHVFVSDQNRHQVDIIFTEIEDHNVQIHLIDSKLSYDGYQRFVCSAEHYQQYYPQGKGCFVLLTQVDVAMLKPIEEKWFEYDCVGAPWNRQFVDSQHQNHLVGNGGFCLRAVDATIAHLQRCGNWSPTLGFNEDVYLSIIIPPNRLPTTADAAEFSSETIFHPSPCGVHKPWPYQPVENVRHFMNEMHRFISQRRTQLTA